MQASETVNAMLAHVATISTRHARGMCALLKPRRTIPHVDLAPWFDGSTPAAERRAIAVALGHAFEEYGFCVATLGSQIIPVQAVSAELRDSARLFFAADDRSDWDSGQGYGYGGLVTENENGAGLTGDFDSDRAPDLVESLTIRGLAHLATGNVAAPGDSPVFCQDMSDPGRLDLIPTTPAALAATVGCFHDALSQLRVGLCGMSEVALELPDRYLSDRCDSNAAGLRLAHYPEQAHEPPPGQLRYGAHADSGAITVVILDPACPRGLEVRLPASPDGGEPACWVDVCDGKDGVDLTSALVLNCGATLERWTNGRWRAALHRVANHRRSRLSVITSALSPGPEVLLECLPSCRGQAGAKALRPPVLVRDFLDERVRQQRPGYRPEPAEAS